MKKVVRVSLRRLLQWDIPVPRRLTGRHVKRWAYDISRIRLFFRTIEFPKFSPIIIFRQLEFRISRNDRTNKFPGTDSLDQPRPDWVFQNVSATLGESVFSSIFRPKHVVVSLCLK